MNDYEINRCYNRLVAVLIVICILALMLLLGGCMTTYSVERVMPDGSFVKVVTKSFRKFEQPKLEYETPDGTVFRFNAESAGTDYSPVEYAAADVLKAVTIGAIPLPIKQIPQE